MTHCLQVPRTCVLECVQPSQDQTVPEPFDRVQDRSQHERPEERPHAELEYVEHLEEVL